jgi:hypothetical protein
MSVQVLVDPGAMRGWEGVGSTGDGRGDKARGDATDVHRHCGSEG